MAQHKLDISELDFENIKGSLKRFLGNQNEFKDYDFEGSSMAILLDLLAYNTHYLGLQCKLRSKRNVYGHSTVKIKCCVIG